MGVPRRTCATCSATASTTSRPPGRTSWSTGSRDGAAFRDYFKARYGPTIAVYRALADEPDRVAALDAALADLGDRHLTDGVMAWEYLLLTARRR